MPEQTAVAVARVKETVPVKLPADTSELTREIYDSISRRAFDMFESNGRVIGHDLEDWVRAECELLQPIRLDISESENTLTMWAEVPGFGANEVAVSVEPWRLTIAEKRENKEQREGEKLIRSERCVDRILSFVDLPAQVDNEKVSATLKSGVLELVLPKAVAANAAELESKAETKGGKVLAAIA